MKTWPPTTRSCLSPSAALKRPADVIPFLQNVTAGRNIPVERLEHVAEHYYRFGGVSPINQQCRDLIAAVEKDFAARGVHLPVYWGNRNWDPYLADTLAAMAADGVTRALAFVTSGYSSFSSCRQYLDDIEAARRQAGDGAPQVDKIRQYFNHPGYIGSFAAAAADGHRVAAGGHQRRLRPDLHGAQHPAEHGRGQRTGRRRLPGSAGRGRQAGRGRDRVPATVAPGVLEPQRTAAVPWLEPDINDLLAERAAAGSRAVVVVPIGFVSDHMEVKFDLDVEAAEHRGQARTGLCQGSDSGHGSPVRIDDHRPGLRAPRRHVPAGARRARRGP